MFPPVAALIGHSHRTVKPAVETTRFQFSSSGRRRPGARTPPPPPTLLHRLFYGLAGVFVLLPAGLLSFFLPPPFLHLRLHLDLYLPFPSSISLLLPRMSAGSTSPSSSVQAPISSLCSSRSSSA